MEIKNLSGFIKACTEDFINSNKERQQRYAHFIGVKVTKIQRGDIIESEYIETWTRKKDDDNAVLKVKDEADENPPTHIVQANT